MANRVMPTWLAIAGPKHRRIGPLVQSAVGRRTRQRPSLTRPALEWTATAAGNSVISTTVQYLFAVDPIDGR